MISQLTSMVPEVVTSTAMSSVGLTATATEHVIDVAARTLFPAVSAGQRRPLTFGHSPPTRLSVTSPRLRALPSATVSARNPRPRIGEKLKIAPPLGRNEPDLTPKW